MYLENCLLLFHSCEKNGPNALDEKILGVRMDKSWRISSSDWGADKFRYAIFRICEWCSDCKQYFPEVGKTKILSTEPRFRYIPLEKETENSLTPWDACVEGKTMKLTSSQSIEH